MSELQAVLVQLRRRVDDHFVAAQARSPDAFACRPGCDACCHPDLGVFAVEAAPIRQALARLEIDAPALRARIRSQADDPGRQRCAFLVDGLCAVYAERPLICRSHGLPVLTPEPDPGIETCPLNFTAAPPPRASVLRLDALNQPLAVLASLWDETISSAGGDLPGHRIALTDLAREPASGPAPSKAAPSPPERP